MTNADAIALQPAALVRHKSGKLYRVGHVNTQPTCSYGGDRGIEFTGNPLPVAKLGVIGQRNGEYFGPWRSLKASDCELVDAKVPSGGGQ